MGLKLEKGNKLNLAKADGSQLTKIVLGLGWDVAKGSASIDLDASCVLIDGSKEKVDVVWFRQLKSRCSSIEHTGDNRTGAGDGDDEQIKVDLTKVPSSVQSLVFTVNSFLGQSFDKIANAYVRVLDGTTELCKYDLGAKGPHTGMIMGKVYRHNGGWKFAALGEIASGSTVDAIMPQIKNVC